MVGIEKCLLQCHVSGSSVELIRVDMIRLDGPNLISCLCNIYPGNLKHVNDDWIW